MRRYAMALLALASITAHAGDKLMDSWVGDSSANLIQKWGPPARYSPDGQGGEVLVYESCHSVQSGPWFRGDAVRWKTQCATREFFVDPTGRIYSWRTQGRW